MRVTESPGIKRSLSPTTLLKQVPYNRWGLNISMEGDFTRSLDSLFQCSITLNVKFFHTLVRTFCIQVLGHYSLYYQWMLFLGLVCETGSQVSESKQSCTSCRLLCERLCLLETAPWMCVRACTQVLVEVKSSCCSCFLTVFSAFLHYLLFIYFFSMGNSYG